MVQIHCGAQRDSRSPAGPVPGRVFPSVGAHRLHRWGLHSDGFCSHLCATHAILRAFRRESGCSVRSAAGHMALPKSGELF